MGNTVTWAEYWNGETTVYVNARHTSVHYETVARDMLRHLPGPNARVVDYGCGEALSAQRLADACGHLYLCDSAPRVRERLLVRYGGHPKISIAAPGEFEQLPAGTIDLIVVNSVIQYLSEGELAHLLGVSRAKLSPRGRLLLADIVPRNVGPLRDALELLKFARANDFLFSAAVGLVKSYFSRYRRVRERLGFLQLDEPEVTRLLAEAGFVARRHYPNLGHNTHRMTLLAVLEMQEAGLRAPPQPMAAE
jgi:SAM-dependent methyltransferase